MKRIAPIFLITTLIAILAIVQRTEKPNSPQSYTPEEWRQMELAEKRKKREAGYSKMDQPGEFCGPWLWVARLSVC